MENSKFINDNFINYVSKVSPRTNEVRTLFRAFWVGGLICCLGQSFRMLFENVFSLSDDVLAAYVSMVMIFLGGLLTAFGVYDRIGKYAGAGSIVPITGFANSVVSPAIEFKTEGYIYGLASKMFVIAGPIIVFGISSSVLVGLIYYFIYNVL
ncbi:MAG: stage V sporulation protein AC [Clostridia bacterium]|nr:stage V sporulation protein AC [Clostridia bacterium]